MIKRSFRLMLLGAFALSSVMFVACNKYDEDIERIDNQLASLEQTVQSLKAAVDAGSVVTSVSESSTGITFKLSNGQSYTVKHGANGADGKDGVNGTNGVDGKSTIITIDPETNNWIIDGVDTGICAKGKDGVDGKDGVNGKDGVDGKDGVNGKDGVDGKDGKDGQNGKDGKDGQNGKDGKDGKNAYSPYIGEDGNWVVWNDETQKFEATQVSAKGASTYVVDCGYYWELNVMEKVDGENAEFVTVRLPKTAIITNLKPITLTAPAGSTDKNKINDVTPDNPIAVYYGKLSSAKKFNNVNYAKNTYLYNTTSKISVIVNPVSADATQYTFKLMDSKGTSPYVLGAATPNMTNNALTKAASANEGVYDLAISLPSNFSETNQAKREGAVYALATTNIYDEVVASDYVVKIDESTAVTAPTIGSSLNDNGTRSIDLTKVFSSMDYVSKYYFSFANQNAAAAIGASINGDILTATTNGSIDIKVSYMLVDGTVYEDNNNTATGNAATTTAVFDYIAPQGSLGNVDWTIQNDKVSTTKVNETEVFVSLGSLQNQLAVADDYALPTFAIKARTIGTTTNVAWTWDDNTLLDSKTIVVQDGSANGVKYGKNGIAFAGNENTWIAEIDPEFWYMNASTGRYTQITRGTTKIQTELFVKFKFSTTSAFPTYNNKYKVVLGFNKPGNNSANYDREVPVTVTINAPTAAIVKKDNLFSGNDVTVYGTANGATVNYNLYNLFVTTAAEGLEFSEKVYAKSSTVNYTPWLGTNGDIVVPVYGASTTAFENAYATREYSASVWPLANTHVNKAIYKFNVTVKSEIAEGTLNAAAMALSINNTEVTPVSLKGVVSKDVFGTTYNVAPVYTYDKNGNVTDTKLADARLSGVKVILKDSNAKQYLKLSNDTNTTVFAESAAKDGASTFDVQRRPDTNGGFEALAKDVVCTLELQVTDVWGKTTKSEFTITLKKN